MTNSSRKPPPRAILRESISRRQVYEQCPTGAGCRSIPIIFVGAISSFSFSSRRSRNKTSRRNVIHPPVYSVRDRVIAGSASVSRMPRIRASNAIFFSSLNLIAQPRIFDGALDGARANQRRGPRRRCARRRRDTGFAERAGWSPREEPPFPFARKPAARPLRLDTAPLSSSTTAEILRESVG